MSSKNKTSKQPAIPDNIVLTSEQKKLPEVKALFKVLKEEREKAETEKKLMPIVEFANKSLSQSFKTWAQMVKHVEKITEGTKRAERLSPEQKTKIDALSSSDKTHKQIATEVKCKTSQVSTYLFTKNKKK